MSADTRGGARTFVRSLNILLKFARLYEFGHARTAAQFDSTWKELRNALDESAGGGLLLGASGNQILLDGVPLGAAAGERSFAQLLISSGIASIHFSPALTQPQFARFVRAFPSGNAKPASLADQLKSALAGETTIKVNEIRYVAEDSSVAGIKIAAQLTAKALGAQGDKFRDFLEDPNKMLQMILAAESARGGGGGGGGGGLPGLGSGGNGPGFGGGGGGTGGTGSGSGGSGDGATRAGGGDGTAGAANLWDARPGGGSAVVQAAAPVVVLVVVLVAERVLRKGLGQEVWEDREQASVASGTVAEALVAALARDQGAAPVRGLEVAERVQGRAAEKE